jgi:hypothetical protein
MSAIAAITVFDGAASPVSHTFTPISVTRVNGKVIAEYREALVSVPAYAQPRITLTLERLKSGVYRSEMRTVVPVMEAILNQNAAGYTAAPKVAYENTVVVSGLFHERSDITGRRLVKQMVANLMNNLSTTTPAITAGPLAELVDQLVAPT